VGKNLAYFHRSSDSEMNANGVTEVRPAHHPCSRADSRDFPGGPINSNPTAKLIIITSEAGHTGLKE